MQHCRNDACCAIRRSRDHATTGGILLIDGQREHRDPLHGVQCVIVLKVVAQLIVQLLCTSADFQTSGQLALGLDAVLHTVAHDLPDMHDLGTDFMLRPTAAFIRHHHFGDAEVVLRADFEQLATGGEWVRHWMRILDDCRTALAFLDDEAAANRVERALLNHVAFGVQGAEEHAICMERQRPTSMQHDVHMQVEVDRLHAGEPQLHGVANLLLQSLHLLGVHDIRQIPREPGDDCANGAVTMTCGTERAEQLGTHSRHM
mgnify:CR=1 FL=1